MSSVINGSNLDAIEENEIQFFQRKSCVKEKEEKTAIEIRITEKTFRVRLGPAH